MRTKYKCVCDKCKQEITAVNDENDVSLNTGHYQFCAPCYDDLCGTIDIWMRKK